MKAVALLSGGLDSTLAAKVVLEQGIELQAINFLTLFCNCTNRGETCLASQKAVQSLGISLRVIHVSEEYLSIVKNPRHGYGSNMNPCIDCRIFMMKKAKEYMREVGASFLVTGEVLGERPMSQRRDAMRLIEKEADLEGLILRPLSAKLLPPSLPEREGWVDREKLLRIQGRSRKPQIQLAAIFGIQDYPCPAGGCLLTDPGFAKRIRDLFVHQPDFTLNDVHLLKVGRHYRFSDNTKLVIGRNEEENQKVQTFSLEGDLLLKAAHYPGPLSLLRNIGGGRPVEEEVRRAAAITARYSKARGLESVEVLCRRALEETSKTLIVTPAPESEIEKWMIQE